MLLTLMIIQFVILVSIIRGTGKRVSSLEQEVGTLRERLLKLDQTDKAPSTISTEVASDDAAQHMLAEPDRPMAPEISEAVTEEADLEPPVIAARAETTADGVSEAAEPAITLSTEPVPLTAPRTASASEDSLENLLGARWAVWAGGLALALGGIFLVRYSIESGLLGPGVRLSLAALFGLLLIGGAELIRRKALPKAAALYENAMIPGILTAAGAVSIFGSIYAAHGIYEFIGPTPAFLLLALTAFAVLGLSLLHGQALAGLGLAGSMITPALIASTGPRPWTLFGFLAVVQVATSAASRIRGWHLVPGLAHLALGFWVIAYLAFSDYTELTPVALALIAMIASWALVWPGRIREDDGATDQAVIVDSVSRQLGRGPIWLDISMAIAILLPALAMLGLDGDTDLFPSYVFATLIATLAAAGSQNKGAIWPSMLAGFGAVIGALFDGSMVTQLVNDLIDAQGSSAVLTDFDGPLVLVLLGLGAIFLMLGVAFLARSGRQAPVMATVWASLAAAMPILLATISFLFYGIYAFDLTHGLYAVGVGAALIVAAELLHRGRFGMIDGPARDILVSGGFAAFALALHVMTDGLVTTLALAVLGFGFLVATRLRSWASLPWMMVAALAGVMLRIGSDPTLVGPDALSRTPFFNQLLPGYGIPALLAISAAYELRNWPGERVRNALQGIAALMSLLTIAILVRHAMNGGVLDSSTPTLGEQSIYTLLVIGMSGILMTLDRKSPSHVFRYGSMIAGALSILQILSLHLGALNPYFSGESTGDWPLVNLLLIGYLIPGLSYAGLAVYARGKRPLPYVTMLALSGAILGFSWVTLSVRRFWQGEYIAYWKGFEQAETYSYSVAWLVIGVGLLVLGSRFDARSLRITSAVIVMLSVAKAFLVDMSHLEGVLRALSFIGLGFVLIGIGLFYQRILARKSSTPDDGGDAPGEVLEG
ncbi:DUF2339 domain-containing protein [Rhizobium sp. G187]|uniref:DUF2339 domain-containing protein n=1 Tax=Rhizobium sp. G187 TaxID=3451352 RepID=UPI003EE7E6A4